MIYRRYVESLNFKFLVNPGKLIFVSLAISNIVQELEKSEYFITLNNIMYEYI